MKASRFSEAQIAFVLKQAEDGTSVGEVCRKAGISEATFYNWRKLAQEVRWADALWDEAVEAARGGERQAQTACRRPQPGQGDVAGRAIKKALRPARRRALVDEVRADWQVSIRRACGVLRAGRSTYHYRPRRDDQAVLKLKIKEIAETRVRYGYRRIHVLLHREG
jgi:putative transposase